MNMSMNIPTHPFVECNIEGVNAHALIDTGSMKSFIRQDIYNTIDFEGTRLGKVNEQCKSITGDPLNLLGKLNVVLNLLVVVTRIVIIFLLVVTYSLTAYWDGTF